VHDGDGRSEELGTKRCFGDGRGDALVTACEFGVVGWRGDELEGS
jgi:hypothetical protein